jgi:hypothetical protein
MWSGIPDNAIPRKLGAIKPHESVCAGNQISARTSQLNRAGEASEESNELHMEANQRITPLKEGNTRSKDQHLTRQEQREQNYSTERMDGSTPLVQMNESVEPYQSGTATLGVGGGGVIDNERKNAKESKHQIPSQHFVLLVKPLTLSTCFRTSRSILARTSH